MVTLAILPRQASKPGGDISKNNFYSAAFLIIYHHTHVVQCNIATTHGFKWKVFKHFSILCDHCKKVNKLPRTRDVCLSVQWLDSKPHLWQWWPSNRIKFSMTRHINRKPKSMWKFYYNECLSLPTPLSHPSCRVFKSNLDNFMVLKSPHRLSASKFWPKSINANFTSP